MTQYLLTNRQREYLGLHPVEASWELVQLKDLILFFDQDVIRKVICYEQGQQYGYMEYDYELSTQDRKQLLPATARGKPKPLSPANILSRKPLGFSFVCYFGWKGKSFNFQHLYVTHTTNDESLVSLHDHGITSFEALEAWVEEFMASCPPDHLQRIDELREKKLARIRYRSGDVFEIPLSKGTVGYGRILLDVYRLRRAGLFGQVPHCGLDGPVLGSGLLVVLYKYAGPSVTLEEISELPTLTTQFLMHDDIYRGKFPIIGNIPASGDELDFPEGVTRWHAGKGKQDYYFQKGGLALPLKMTAEEYDPIPHVRCFLSLVPRWIQEASQDDAEAVDHLFKDLRHSDQRADILKRCGLKPKMSYTEMVAAKGGIPPEEFLRATQELK
ncbi:MAG: immunity 26/phosphotriesterase HocA family protein [Planctomycetaceae bacterium]|nr:immunity 26/phosphotriesterase HocA family protein [Planctomycetaceae bacterium]